MPQKPWRIHHSLPFGENLSARYPCPFSYNMRARTKIYTDVPQGTSASSDTALRHVDSRLIKGMTDAEVLYRYEASASLTFCSRASWPARWPR